MNLRDMLMNSIRSAAFAAFRGSGNGGGSEAGTGSISSLQSSGGDTAILSISRELIASMRALQQPIRLPEQVGTTAQAVSESIEAPVRSLAESAEKLVSVVSGGISASGSLVGIVSTWLKSSSIMGRIRGSESGESDQSEQSGHPAQTEKQLPGALSRLVATLDGYLAKVSRLPDGQNSIDRLIGRNRKPSAFKSAVRNFSRRAAYSGRRLIRRNLQGRAVNIAMRQAVAAAGGGGGGVGAGGVAGVAGGGGAAGGIGAAAGAAGGGGGGAGIGGAAIGLLLNPITLTIVAIVAMIVAVVSVTKMLKAFGEQGYQTALRVADYNASLYSARAQLEFGRLGRDIKTGNALAESGSDFMQALNGLEDAIRPLTDMLQDVGLKFLTVLTKLTTDIAQLLVKFVVFTRIIEFLEWIILKLDIFLTFIEDSAKAAKDVVENKDGIIGNVIDKMGGPANAIGGFLGGPGGVLGAVIGNAIGDWMFEDDKPAPAPAPAAPAAPANNPGANWPGFAFTDPADIVRPPRDRIPPIRGNNDRGMFA